jgi:hypothetical protein
MRDKMKKTIFLVIMLVPGLLVFALWRANTAFSSDAAGSLSKTQILGNAMNPPRQLMAERTDNKDSITYGTDPEMERAMAEQERHEKEKEENAWKMLQNMNIYQGGRKNPHPNQPDNTPSQ